MKKIILLIAASFGILGAAQAQKVTTRVVDNKGTIKWVIDSTTSVVTRAVNGITKTGDSVKLGGTLVETTTIATSATEFLRLTGLQGGSRADSVVMINNATGQLKKMSVADLISTYANNGLTKVADSIQLGGSLTKPTTITATATNTLAIPGLQSGTTNDSAVVVDASTGVMKRIDLKAAVKASNGLTKSGDTVKLGGNLIENTNVTLNGKTLTFTTSASDSMKITNLRSGNLATDSIVVVDNANGTLRRVSSSTLLTSGEQIFTATTGLTSYTVTNLPAQVTRVWVYRNGVKLFAGTDYTVSGTTVTLIPSATPPNDWSVVAGDRIEVQWVK
jgi:hypothetical protein